MDELFSNNKDAVVSSNRILHTPSSFARSSLLHLQEIGTLQALAPHTSSRFNLQSYLFFTVLSGSGVLIYDGKKYDLKKGDMVFIEKGLDLLLTRIKPEHSAAIPPAVNRFLESVFDTEGTPGSIASYAEAIGISENYLSRLVKNTTGRSVGAWIDIVRIQRAKRMLSTTALSVIDIAAAVGMEDQSYFSRFFKKETGMTPSAFRKQMQG